MGSGGIRFLFFLSQEQTQAMPEVAKRREQGKEGEEGTPSEKEVKQVAPEPTGKFGKELGHGMQACAFCRQGHARNRFSCLCSIGWAVE